MKSHFVTLGLRGRTHAGASVSDAHWTYFGSLSIFEGCAIKTGGEYYVVSDETYLIDNLVSTRISPAPFPLQSSALSQYPQHQFYSRPELICERMRANRQCHLTLISSYHFYM